MLSHTSTGFTPPGKYGPAGEAITQYRYSADGRTPSPTSAATMNGRRYIDSSPPAGGTHSRSTSSSSASEARNSSSGSCAIASRAADARNRAAFASGRNEAIDPSGWR